MSERDANFDFNAPGRAEASPRKPWASPRVILSAMGDAQSKTPGAATPDSHFGSVDYGDAS